MDENAGTIKRHNATSLVGQNPMPEKKDEATTFTKFIPMAK